MIARENLIDSRKIHQTSNLVAVLHLQADTKTSSQHTACLIHLSLQNRLANTGGADRFPIQIDWVTNVQFYSVFLGNFTKLLGRSCSFFPKGKIITTAQFFCAHLFNQHFLNKLLRLHVFESFKVRHDNQFKAHPLQNRTLLLIWCQTHVIFFDLRN